MSVVGIDCFANLHREVLTLDSTCMRHSVVQSSVVSWFELVVFSPSQASLFSLVVTNILYADLTEKTPPIIVA
jgi:hypothetical protein